MLKHLRFGVTGLTLVLALGANDCGGKAFEPGGGGEGTGANAGLGGSAAGKGGTDNSGGTGAPAGTGHQGGSGGTGGKGGGGKGGSAGSGGVSGSGGAGGIGGFSGGAGAGGASGSGGSGGGCSACAGRGLTCCDGVCRNLVNDPKNCGKCGETCPDSAALCSGGTCVAPTCTAELCAPKSVCCGASCCAAGQLCCQSSGGPARLDGEGSCTDPVNGTCPVGCPLCICASPDTPISTPHGDVPIATLKPGDLVFSTSANGVVVVPVLRINRAPVSHHFMARLSLENGAVLELSPGHPTADGRKVGNLIAGERLDGVRIVAAERVPYDKPYTYDILTGSPSGAYFAGGVLMGSTLRDQK